MYATRAQVERVPVEVCRTSAEACHMVAQEIATLIRERAANGRTAVLGLPTGSTPHGIYDELVRLHRDEGLSFANVVTFNLDEYWPMDPAALQSYRRFMNEYLFDHVDIDPRHVHIPDGTLDRGEVARACDDYEAAIRDAGGIDLQILGIGRTGHVGFNEPGSDRASRTRLITLDTVTRMDAASDFFGEWNVPRKAITMGVGSILDARRIVLVAFGEHKAPIIRRAVEEPVTSSVAASFLQEHPSATIVLDPAAAASLTRFQTPWQLGSIDRFGLEWDHAWTKKATIWLARTLEKAILKLTDEDYNAHGLQDLLSARGGAYDINLEVFKALRNTITGWPGGKPGRPKFVPGAGVDSGNPPDVVPKRVVVFSPHPDDDVISMGGTLIRLCEQGHEVHVAYQTSGNIAVFDEDAERHADFLLEMLDRPGAPPEEAEEIRSVLAFIRAKSPGTVDSAALQRIKTLIRRTEARSAARYSGVSADRIHFLDLPFYETGRVRKNPMGEQDVEIVTTLLERVRPHLVYAAGDLSDPHGTHRVCLDATLAALEKVSRRPEDASWCHTCELWLYRGAWQEWEPHELHMAVPLSPSEVDRKRTAIFRHESQKDRALFPGPYDRREFWQRAEQRNRATAELYDQLGLAEYEAIEAFVRWEPRG
ncbi:MAG: glucosamine-6-phosphate deaminase [Phycisphaerae bacterium]|nr:glucosamine-6-phosphate deaminase [Phycisphaerae bacterium]NNF42649.1 glucosamine-6-phosphate deaminase [Phycisphaerales bacterium]